MKRLTILITSILVLIFSAKNISAQKAAAEFITSISPPSLSDTIFILDGERYVTYKDNYLFIVNFWSGVQILDISNIQSPQKISFIRTRDMVHHVTIHENYLFISNEAEGVLVYDFTTPTNPREITRIETPGDAYWTTIRYPYLFVALGANGFCIMDITDLENPRTVALDMPGAWVWSLTVQGNRLFVGAKQEGILVYDITDPGNITRPSQYRTGSQALHMNLEGNLAYVADGPGGLLILDFSSLELPKKVGEFKISGFSRHVNKSGNYAYLSNREMGLLIVNVSDPTKPFLEGQYIPETETFCSAKKDIYVFLTSDSKTEILRHNNQPVLQPLSDALIPENNNFVLQLKAEDKDGDPLTFEASNLPPGSTFDTQTGLFTWRPTYEQAGVYPNVIFKVLEETGSRLSDSDTIQITVSHVNRLPELPPIENVTIPEDSLITIQVPEATDPDAEDQGRIRYRVQNMPEGAHFDSTSRIFTWKPGFDQAGIYVVDFLADDGAGGIDRESVTFTIQHVDRPPTIQPIEDRVIDEGQTLVVQVTGEELDKEDQNRITFSMQNLPEGAVFNPATAQLSWTPGYDQSGTYSDILAIMTAGVLADSTSFSITVNHVNRPPVLAEVGDQVVRENELLSFPISGSDPDVEDAGKLVFTASNLPEGAVFDSASLSFQWTPTFEQAGEYPGITFTVSDPQGLSDQKTITITVQHVNRPPILSEVPSYTVNENEVLTFQLSASDPDKEDAGKLTYSASPLPEGAVLNERTGEFKWTPTFEQSGTYKLQFAVSDGELSDSDSATITVNHVNRPPILEELVDQTIDENQPLLLTIKGSDPDVEDAGKLIFSASNLPEGAAFDPATQTFRWTPTYEQAGIYSTILFQVTDPAGLTAEKSLTINVNHVNRPPSIEEIPPITAVEMQPMVFSLSESDPDLEDTGKFRYQISGLPPEARVNPQTGEFSWTPTYDQAGEYDGVAQVSDPAGGVAQTPLKISVANVNRPPEVETMGVISGRENEELNVTLKFADPDKEDAGKLVVTASGLPEGARVDDTNGNLSWKPSYEQSGEYTISYQVTDSYGASAEGTLTLKIENVNRAPNLNSVGNMTIKEGESVNFSLQAEDPDREDQGKLKFSANGLPAGADFDGSSGRFSWTPSEDQQGEYEIEFTVEDPQGLNDKITVKITVEDVPPPPPPQN
ncbi:MAG: hypothetical protein Kow0042_11750 [Calditrichia bacterium]